MSGRFTDVQLNLEILAEECAEVIQIKSKVTRFGLDDRHPAGGPDNRDRLEEEIGHVLAMVDVLTDNGILSLEGLNQAKEKKLQKLQLWYRR